MRTLYRAATVHTNAHPPTGEWILVDGRHVERVGTGEPPAAERLVELPGATILPGFVDAHVHLTGTGEHYRAPEIAAARSADGLLEATRRVLELREGPVLVHGYDESKWERPGLPSIADLDGLTDRPLAIVRVDGHLSLANTRALEGSGALEAEGIDRDAEGRPTGRATKQANATLRRWFQAQLSDRDIEQLQLDAASLAARHGVTCAHEMSMPGERGVRDLEILLAHRARLPVDVVTYVGTTDIAMVMDLGITRIGGDLAIDGSIGARTAWPRDGFLQGETTGGSFDDDDLAEFFHDAHLAGLQVGVHAIGDGAIEQVLRTWERVYQTLDSRARRHFRARRHRIEHFEMVGPGVIERAAALGLAISVQPAFDAEWGRPGGLYEQALGPERAAAMNPFRSFIERGLEVGAGSDSPITSIDPMEGIAAFETHHDPEQRLSREEAMRAYNLGSARLAHLEGKKGTLAPGTHADFAVFDADPIATPSVAGLRPILTVSLGRDVFVD